MGEVSNTAEEARCVLCNVPKDLHGTVCGWENASVEVIGNMIINDVRHPGFGQPLNLWKRTYMDGSEDSYEITEKNSYKFGWDAGVAHASQQTEQLTRSNNFMKGKLLELSKENEELHSVNAELRSLKQSILESPLKQHFPSKGSVSFHDKVVLAIHTLQKENADLRQQTEQLRKEKDYAAEWFGHKLNLAEKEIADLRQQLADPETRDAASYYQGGKDVFDNHAKPAMAKILALESKIKELEAGNEELKAFIKDVRSYAGFAFSKDEDRAKRLIDSIL